MSFDSIVFIWLFLPITLLGYFLIKRKHLCKLRNPFLVLTSLFFYAWGDINALLFLLIVITCTWGVGGILDRITYKKMLLALSIVGMLSCLGYYKYWDFLISQLGDIFKIGIGLKDNYVPIGISFVVFQCISYLIDVYRGDIESDNNWIHIALYISFFPQIISGPIVRYSEVKDAIIHPNCNLENFEYGMERFILGLAKKVIIADCLGNMVDTILSFDESLWGSLFSWCIMLGYSFQIYYDFSGYSDMAVGLGRMFGFRLPENFNLPYTATSVQNFWRRWHMTLSSWFKDYLYIPLGGNRKGKIRTYLNLSVVFFTTGLWHGASWNFIFWGLWHGFFQLLERLRLGKFLKKNKYKEINIFYTCSVVFLGWIFFRLTSIKTAFHVIRMLFIPVSVDERVSLYYFINPYTLFIMCVAFLFCGPVQKIYCKISNMFAFQEKKSSLFFGVKWSMLILVFLYSLSQVVSSTYNAFIYQQF